jgi:hypothetical protein
MTTLALISAGVTSTGGVTALAVSRLCGKNDENKQMDMNKDEERKTWRSRRH